MKLKKLICLILLCSVILFTGCASVEYGRIVNKDGSIIDAVSVKLDETKISNAGFDINEVKNGVKTKMSNYLLTIINSFQNKDDGLTNIEKFAVLNNLDYMVVEKNDYIIASIKFKNYNTFKFFYGLHLIDDSEDSSPTKIEEFLVNKYVNTGKTIFAGADAQYVINDFLAYFNNTFTIEDANLSYVFGTSEDKLYSDATNHYKIDGINYHEWIINDINQEINTYTLRANPVNWYILALGLTFALIVILFVISLFVKKRNKPLTTFELNDKINKTIDTNLN